MQLSDAGKQEMYARISVGKSTTLVKSETHSEYAFQGNTTPTRTAHDALFEAKERTRWRSSSSGCAPLQRASLSCLQCHRNCLRKKGCTAGGTHVTTARKRYKDSRGCDDAWAKDLAEKQYHNHCFLRAVS